MQNVFLPQRSEIRTFHKYVEIKLAPLRNWWDRQGIVRETETYLN